MLPCSFSSESNCFLQCPVFATVIFFLIPSLVSLPSPSVRHPLSIVLFLPPSFHLHSFFSAIFSPSLLRRLFALSSSPSHLHSRSLSLHHLFYIALTSSCLRHPLCIIVLSSPSSLLHQHLFVFTILYLSSLRHPSFILPSSPSSLLHQHLFVFIILYLPSLRHPSFILSSSTLTLSSSLLPSCRRFFINSQSPRHPFSVVQSSPSSRLFYHHPFLTLRRTFAVLSVNQDSLPLSPSPLTPPTPSSRSSK